MGEAPEKFNLKEDMTQKEEDEIIDKLTKKKVPKRRRHKREDSGQNSGLKSSRRNNLPKAPLPPKRIRADDASDLFPALIIEGSEQKKLYKIAEQIGAFAQDVAVAQSNHPNFGKKSAHSIGQGSLGESPSSAMRMEGYKDVLLDRKVSVERSGP